MGRLARSNFFPSPREEETRHSHTHPRCLTHLKTDSDGGAGAARHVPIRPRPARPAALYASTLFLGCGCSRTRTRGLALALDVVGDAASCDGGARGLLLRWSSVSCRCTVVRCRLERITRLGPYSRSEIYGVSAAAVCHPERMPVAMDLVG
jgi:hypothetical protein